MWKLGLPRHHWPVQHHGSVTSRSLRQLRCSCWRQVFACAEMMRQCRRVLREGWNPNQVHRQRRCHQLLNPHLRVRPPSSQAPLCRRDDRPARAPHSDVIRMPKIQNVFGNPAGTVAAASVPEAEVRIAALPEPTPAADPVSVSALSIAPLTAGATAAPPAAGQKSSTAPSADVKPRPGPPATGVRRRNVNIEVAITEQTGVADPVKKVVTMVVADGQMGSVRSTGSAMEPAAGAVGAPEVVVEGRPLTLNIDASPTVRADDSVQLSLTLEYAPRPDDADKKSATGAAERASGADPRIRHADGDLPVSRPREQSSHHRRSDGNRDEVSAT